MRVSLPWILTGLLSSTPSTPLAPDLPNKIDLPQDEVSMLPDPETVRVFLQRLDQATDSLEYQLRSSVGPLLDYGVKHPEKTQPRLYCHDDRCVFSITFQEANHHVFTLEECEDAGDNYSQLELQARRLGILAAPAHDSARLPRLTVIGQHAILTFVGPQDCTDYDGLNFLSYSFGSQTLNALFPNCIPLQRKMDAGCEVIGLGVRGLSNTLHPQGIHLNYTVTPKNDP